MVTDRELDHAFMVHLAAVCATTTISIGPPPCSHGNGTYREIPARWFGRRTVFVCGDCENVLNAKTKEKL